MSDNTSGSKISVVKLYNDYNFVMTRSIVNTVAKQ